MSRKILIASIVLILILAAGLLAVVLTEARGGVWYGINFYSKPKSQTISAVPQGWKTYVSKYGFSVTYPKDWKLEEDEYSLKALRKESGKAPFDLLDGKGNSLSFAYYEYPKVEDFNLFEDEMKLSKEVLQSNLIKIISGKKTLSIQNGRAYIFWGESKNDPGINFLIVFIWLKKMKGYLFVSEEIYGDEDFNRAKIIFEKSLSWIKLEE